MDELTLRDYIKIVFRQKWVIILTIISVLAIAKISLYMVTPKYTAKVKMLVSAQKVIESPYYLQLGTSQSESAVSTQSEIVKSNPVLSRALTVIGIKNYDYEMNFAHNLKKRLLDKQNQEREKKFIEQNVTKEQQNAMLYRNALEDLRGNLKIEPIRDTNMFYIQYSDFSPIVAAAIANIISRSYVIFDLEQQLSELLIKYGNRNPAITQLKDSINTLTKNLNGDPISDVEALGPASVKIVEQAIQPLSPDGLSPPKILFIAFIISIFVGLMLAFLFDYIDQKFRSPGEMETTLNIPCIGSVPRKNRPESFQHISEQIAYQMKEKNFKTILLTSVMPKEGVTTVTTHLAKLLCQKPKCQVLIVEGNFKNPRLHKIFKISNNNGLFDILEGKLSFDDALVKVNDCLSVLPIGNNLDNRKINKFINIFFNNNQQSEQNCNLDAKCFNETARLSNLFKMAEQKFDCILIDGSNLKDSKTAINWTNYSNALLIIIDTIKTRRQVVKYELGALNGHRAHVLGAVLNKRVYSIPSLIYKRI